MPLTPTAARRLARAFYRAAWRCQQLAAALERQAHEARWGQVPAAEPELEQGTGGEQWCVR